MAYVVMILCAAFGLVNGVHDAGNAIAAPIVTRALRPAPALVLASVFHVVGALAGGTAVAFTVAGIVSTSAAHSLAVIGAAVTGALAWNVFTLWRGIPCSSGHCLVGALAGAALAEGGPGAVVWGGMHGLRPVGVVGSLVWLLLSAAVAVPVAVLGIRLARRLLRRATRRVVEPVRGGEILTSATLAFAHGSNDAQKTMGLLALTLVAGGFVSSLSVPLWVAAVAAVCLTVGTSLGGWRVVRTLGHGIYPLRPLEGLVTQGASSVIVLGASLAGAPVSTTDVVAPATVGVGTGERWRHVRWVVVEGIGLAWLVTLPVCGALGALAYPLWRWVT